MARPLRIEYPGAFYHVMNRGAGKKSIFMNSHEDRTLFLSTLGQAVQQWGTRIHSFSLMDNHYHLLVETPLGNLGRFMRHVDGVYTQKFNRLYQTDGPLFRGRYKSILVEKESYFLELLRYIHLNGTRAGRCESPRVDFFCSHPAYLKLSTAPTWLETSYGLSFFESDKKSSAVLFENFVNQGIPETIEKSLEGKRRPAVLGGPAFIERIKKEFQLGEPPHLEKPQEKQLFIKEAGIPEPQEILHTIANKFGLGVKELQTPFKKEFRPARREAMVQLRQRCRMSYQKIGLLLGGVQDSTVEKVIRRQKRRMSET